MPINLRQVIEGDSTTNIDGFAGAVILTFTLNLIFYEQLIAQSFDRAGCVNVLIIADADGYAGALEMGAQSVRGAGRRYICAPLMHRGRGVQHAKLLLMAGAQRGRMLLGSGNLTLHGYSRNLELFSLFEFDISRPVLQDHYAFIQAWGLLSKLKQAGYLPGTAMDQLSAMQERAPWLCDTVPEPLDFRVWSNFDQSILEQLQTWRAAQGLSQPLRSLRIISPYYDHDIRALRQSARVLEPARVELFLNPSFTNLDGKQLKQEWGREKSKLKVQGLESRTKRAARPLHAKALIGIEEQGAWCVAGSANLTHPALMTSFADGGNLELVTCQWSKGRNAFDRLLEDESIRVWEMKADQILSLEEEPSERLHAAEAAIALTDLTSRGQVVEGRVSPLPSDCPRTGYLEFLSTRQRQAATLVTGYFFRLDLSTPLQQAEAARLELGRYVTPFRWIDQPEELARYGARAYHAQVRAKLETFDGAGKLFQELMDFLWQRFDRQQMTEETVQKHLTIRQRYLEPAQTKTAETPPPPAADFITDEQLVERIYWGVQQQKPYDRSTWSLRDLISLALLRLTSPTRPPETLSQAGRIDEDANQQETAERAAARSSVLENLCNYLQRYCERYSDRLVDRDFVRHTTPQLLFQNHFTLGRTLLEFTDKVDEFRLDDLNTCFWLISAPLVWPSIIQMEGSAALQVMSEQHAVEEMVRAWSSSGMPSMMALLMRRALGTPPDWKEGTGDIDRVLEFMVAREMIARFHGALGNNALAVAVEDLLEARGIQSLEDFSDPRDNSEEQAHELKEYISELETYLPPTEKRYAPLRELQELDRNGQGQSPRAQAISRWFQENGLASYLVYRFDRLPILLMKWGSDVCPKCNLELTSERLNHLEKGELVICSNGRHALLYWCPQLPKSIW